MADSRTIARPYAKAVFAVALSSNALSRWASFLDVLAAFVNEPVVTRWLTNPTVIRAKVREQLLAMATDVLKKHRLTLTDDMQAFLALVAEKKRYMVLPDIAAVFRELVEQHENKLYLNVTSAFPLKRKQKEQLDAALSARFAANVIAYYDVNPSLIGGLVIRSEKWVIDSSITFKLARLAEALV